MQPRDIKHQPGRYLYIILKLLLGLIVIFAITQAIQIWRSDDARVGERPLLQGIDIDGASIDLMDYRGRPVMLYFWGSWCPICRFKYGTVTSISEDYTVLTIAIQSGQTAVVKDALEEAGAKFRVINDPEGYIAQQFNIRGVPTTMIINPNGEIDQVITGYVSELLLRFQLWRLAGSSEIKKG